MNYKNLLYIPLLAIAVMSSCSNDNELNSTNSEYVNSVRVTVADFLPESTTRTAYTVDNSGFHFQWIDGDALGIYPIGGDQVKFPISNGDGSASATFDGGAWKLRSEYQYAAYYPFSVDNYKIDQKSLPASFTGQTQNGNGSTAHLGAYDYLACAATSPDANGGVDLTMKHLGAFVRLQLTMPKADTYSSVVLESDGAEFVTAGTFNLTATTPTITPTETSSTYTINLTNVATTEKDQVITVYAIVAPANLSTSNITVIVHGIGQTTYVQSVSGKNFVARSAYNIAVEAFPSGTNASGEDVSWEEPIDPYNGHTYVDLGLPSGTKWSPYNLDASKPEAAGGYYAFGETSTKYNYSYDNNWASGKSITELIENGYIDSNNSLTRKRDAANVKWGGNWHIPSFTEVHELEDNCTMSIQTVNGQKGMLFTSKINSKTLFFPFLGTKFGTSVNLKNHADEVTGWYSVNTAFSGNSYYRNSFAFGETSSKVSYVARDRAEGVMIRPVTR